MFQNLPLSEAQEVRESSSDVTPCIIVENDGVLCALDEGGAAGTCSSRQYLPSALEVERGAVLHYPVNILCRNEHHLHNTSIHLYGVSRLVHRRSWRCRGVSGNLVRGTHDLSLAASRLFPIVLDDTAGATSARISSLDDVGAATSACTMLRS